MDYLFNTTLIVPKSYSVSCYYIVDDHLKYVSLKNNKSFYLYSIDSDVLGKELRDSENELTLDCYVLESSKPIIKQESKYESVLDKIIRVVRIKTGFGNPLARKPKQTTERSIITRYISKKKKLF